MDPENGHNKTIAEIHGTTVEPFVCISSNIEIKAQWAPLSFVRKDKADHTKITDTRRIDDALPTIKKANVLILTLHFVHGSSLGCLVVFWFRSWRRVPSPLCWHPTLRNLLEESWLV